MRIEESYGIGHVILEDYAADGVDGAWNIDFQLPEIALPAALEIQRIARSIGDRLNVQKQPVVRAARSRIVDGNGAIDAVELALKCDLDLLDYGGRTVG